MSTLKSSAEDLTLNADGSGNDVIIQSDGSTKAIITAEGNVGIGTNAPDTRLHIEATIVNATAPDFPVTIAQVDYSNTVNQLGGSGVGIKLNPATNSGDSVGAALAAIKAGESDDNTETALAFYTSDNDTTLDERLRIDSDGNVLVG